MVATTADSGDIVDIYTYSAYGSSGTEGDAGFPFRFTGQKLDPDAGLYYYKARWYDPATGRFMQTDPIWYEDQTNLYAYVGNDPLNYLDPTGKRRKFGCEDCNVTVVRQQQARERPHDGDTTEKGGGTAPEGGKTYANGDYDADGSKKSRVGRDGEGLPHKGIDIEAQEGDTVVAADGGTVVRADSNSPSFGGQVVIKHPDGKYSRSAHLSSVDVAEGDSVSGGAKVGEVGNTGNASNRPAHLHFEVRDGTGKSAGSYNPDVWLNEVEPEVVIGEDVP